MLSLRQLITDAGKVYEKSKGDRQDNFVVGEDNDPLTHIIALHVTLPKLGSTVSSNLMSTLYEIINVRYFKRKPEDAIKTIDAIQKKQEGECKEDSKRYSFNQKYQSTFMEEYNKFVAAVEKDIKCTSTLSSEFKETDTHELQDCRAVDNYLSELEIKKLEREIQSLTENNNALKTENKLLTKKLESETLSQDEYTELTDYFSLDIRLQKRYADSMKLINDNKDIAEKLKDKVDKINAIYNKYKNFYHERITKTQSSEEKFTNNNLKSDLQELSELDEITLKIQFKSFFAHNTFYTLSLEQPKNILANFFDELRNRVEFTDHSHLTEFAQRVRKFAVNNAEKIEKHIAKTLFAETSQIQLASPRRLLTNRT